MFPNAAPSGSTRPALPSAYPVSNWSVALYRKVESRHDSYQSPNLNQTSGSFYIQLQHQAHSSSPNRSDVLYLRYQYQQQKNTLDSYTLPFTISQLTDMKLSPDTVPLTAAQAASKFYSVEQQTVRK